MVGDLSIMKSSVEQMHSSIICLLNCPILSNNKYRISKYSKALLLLCSFYGNTNQPSTLLILLNSQIVYCFSPLTLLLKSTHLYSHFHSYFYHYYYYYYHYFDKFNYPFNHLYYYDYRHSYFDYYYELAF